MCFIICDINALPIMYRRFTSLVLEAQTSRYLKNCFYVITSVLQTLNAKLFIIILKRCPTFKVVVFWDKYLIVLHGLCLEIQ